ncbi:FecR domain-containing protein [Sphingobacterium sp. DN00404]|uniref:FecR domain-containing protein n=1 Tax=Sphingobacterium micropteri TaxID=2763501 RepID=A0ABR7YJW4_9SPHI|nr:FecR family protein [Sphingobacterium micropteri]MBD1431612.1 FecR domain-containing protein [Sphingobacterium micropteri]
MIYKKKYVKALIRKQIKGVLTPREAGELDACRLIYTHDEIQEMIAEVLLSMEDDELPPMPLDDWKPDFKAIIRKAEKRSRSGQSLWRKIGWGAAVFLPILSILFYWYATREQLPDFIHGPCAGFTADVEVPLTESVVSLKWDGAEVMRVPSEKHGEVLRTADLRVFKTKQGVFQLRESDDGIKSTGTEQGITVATGAQQQAMVELLDGTRIRLNAQSTLQYMPYRQKEEQITIHGEAYIERSDKIKAKTLLIGTSNGFVKSLYGDFALLSLDDLTRAATLRGELSLHSKRRADTVVLDRYGAQGSIISYAKSKDGGVKDTLRYEAITNTDAILVWTKAVRKYKDVPLREFVAQMSFWYGFRVKDYTCLPADRRITTTVCYRKDREAVFAAIREAGVLLYESKGMISFCPEEAKLPKDVGAMLAWWE